MATIIVGSEDPNGRVTHVPNQQFADVHNHVLYKQISVPSGDVWEVVEPFYIVLDDQIAGGGSGITALTGDVTGSGTGSVVTTLTNGAVTTIKITNNAVTYGKFQQVAASSLVGNPTGALANAQAITLDATLKFSGTTLAIDLAHANTWTATQTFTPAPVFSAITATNIMYAGVAGIASGSANLIWDNTNARISIGAGASPSATIHALHGTADQLWLSFSSTKHAKFNVDTNTYLSMQATRFNFSSGALVATPSLDFVVYIEAANGRFGVRTRLVSNSTAYSSDCVDAGAGIYRFGTANRNGVQKNSIAMSSAADGNDMIFATLTGVAGSEVFSEAMRIKCTTNQGRVGIGTGVTVSAQLEVISATEQLRIGFNTADYFKVTVDTAGIATFDAATDAGTLPGFSFAKKVLMTGARFQQAKGANVASANDLTLGTDGNSFTITGNTQINAIATANWQAGARFVLLLTGTPTLKHDTAGGAGTAKMKLASSLDFTPAAGDTRMEFWYDGTVFWELSRTIA